MTSLVWKKFILMYESIPWQEKEEATVPSACISHKKSLSGMIKNKAEMLVSVEAFLHAGFFGDLLSCAPKLQCVC